MQEKDLLTIKDLDVNFYTYEGVVEALDHVNLSLKDGETLGLVGETGCGKSVTSLSVLVLVPSPGKIQGGSIVVNSPNGQRDVLTLDEAAMRKIRGEEISMIFQDPRSALNPVYNVEDQIGEVFMQHRMEELNEEALQQIKKDLAESNNAFKKFFLRYQEGIYAKAVSNPKALSLKVISRIPVLNRYKNKVKQEVRKDVVRLLGLMKIPDPERVVDMFPHELSGGMAQRVVIAMALSCNPGLLIADEPTTNLDVTIQAQILVLIRELKEKFKSSVLYITHDLGVVAELCDRVAVMYAGNVAEIAYVEELFKNPLHPYTQALLESIPRPGKKFSSIEGEVPSLIKPPKGCRFNPRCQKATALCSTEKPALVEVDKDHFVMCHLFR